MDEGKKDEPKSDAAASPAQAPSTPAADPLKCASCGAALALKSEGDTRVQCASCETWHTLAVGPDGKRAAEPESAGFDIRLVGLCVLLWAVAVGIFFSGWDDTKKDYYWGNIRQALEQPMGGYIDSESVDALAAMGEAVLPSCQTELRTQPDPLFKCAVLRVVEQIPGDKSRALLAAEAQEDADARVRANALIILRTRAKKAPAEQAPLAELAKERIANEREVAARAIAAVVLGEAGDKSDATKSLLVYALRITPLRKDAWTCLKQLSPGIPPVDAAREDEALKQVMSVEDWCPQNGIALVSSKLTMVPPPGTPPGAPARTGVAATGTGTTPSAAPSTAPATDPNVKTGK